MKRTLLFRTLTVLCLGQSSQPALAAARELCIDKLSQTFLGQGPAANDWTSMDKAALVDRYLQDPRFIDLFARHVNDTFNDGNVLVKSGAVYHLAKKVVQEDLPWSEMFIGTWDIRTEGQAPNIRTVITANPTSVGYFTNQDWAVLYEGGEGEGFQLRKAYRIPHNMVGLRINPVDAQGKDRKDPAGTCYACHFEPKNIYALDLIAQALPRKRFENGQPVSGSFVPPVYARPEDAPDVLLQKDIVGLKAVVQTLLSERFRNDYNFNVCRMVFQYFYRRPEANNSIDFKQFDACMQAFEAPQQSIRAAVKAMVMTPEFCTYR